MNTLRRHVVPVVAVLFALAVGIALGGGPLSYVSDEESSASDDQSVRDDDPSVPSAPPGEEAPTDGGVADAFAAAAAARVYDGALLGHPTVIVAMPGVQPGLVDAMVGQVALAGGGLTGVFEIAEEAVDRDDTAMVDSLTSQLMTELGDPRVDPSAPTYVRLGQLLSIAVTTPSKSGLRVDSPALAVRASLSTGGLLTGPGEARLAPLVMVLLPESDEDDTGVAEEAPIYVGLTTGLRVNAAGVVLLGDTASGEDGLLSELRRDELVSGTIATVDGGDTVLGQVTAMMALISSLRGSVGAYGASGADGPVPIS